MPRSIEHGRSFVQESRSGENKIESTVDIDLELRANKYWNEFGFPGEPPRSGTLVLERLVNNCQQYERYVSNPRLQGATGWEGARHQIHEQLANMIFGRSLDSLGPDVREHITDFACLVATGLDSRQLGELATHQRIEE